MKNFSKLGVFAFFIAWAFIRPTWADALDFKHIVVFGASLSDPGNYFALTGQTIAPPYTALDEFLVPPAPYSIGGHHYSNGPTWIEQFARAIHLNESVEPAFAHTEQEASNYAVGAARAREDGVNLNLPAQVAAFMDDVGTVAPSEALYVIDIGGNDVRDAVIASSPAESEMILSQALVSVGNQMGQLYAAGARKFLILNTPDLGVLPSIQILDSLFPGAAGFASLLTQLFNDNLDSVTASLAALPGVEIARLNVYEKVNTIIADPAAFGLSEVSVPCITPDVPPFTCHRPDRYLFWDGIHPTKAVHGIFAREVAQALDIETSHSKSRRFAVTAGHFD